MEYQEALNKETKEDITKIEHTHAQASSFNDQKVDKTMEKLEKQQKQAEIEEKALIKKYEGKVGKQLQNQFNTLKDQLHKQEQSYQDQLRKKEDAFERKMKEQELEYKEKLEKEQLAFEKKQEQMRI